MAAMIILGLVGDPAGGKSTAAEFLAGFGAEWINADSIARKCLFHRDVIDALTSRFGRSVLNQAGEIDRARVADLVFGTGPEKQDNLQFLESLVHPRTRLEIHQRIVDAANLGKRVALLDVPLLFESRWDRSCDSIFCITASRENRLSRCEKRDWDAAELDRRESNQMPIETKCRLSNLVMRNDATLESLQQNLRRGWDQLVRIQNQMEAKSGNKNQPQSPHCVSERIVSS
jgi:dephospho-CoA kinase